MSDANLTRLVTPLVTPLLTVPRPDPTRPDPTRPDPKQLLTSLHIERFWLPRILLRRILANEKTVPDNLRPQEELKSLRKYRPRAREIFGRTTKFERKHNAYHQSPA